jgi:uracil-DNA glycosylase
MIRVRFEPTFDGWRAAARRLLDDGAAPESVLWDAGSDEQGALDGLGAEAAAEGDAAPSPRFRVPRRFFELAEAAARHTRMASGGPCSTACSGASPTASRTCWRWR